MHELVLTAEMEQVLGENRILEVSEFNFYFSVVLQIVVSSYIDSHFVSPAGPNPLCRCEYTQHTTRSRPTS